MKKLKLSSETSEFSRFRSTPSTAGMLMLVSCGMLPTGSRPAKTYVDAAGKNEVANKKSGPPKKYNKISCLSGKCSLENARTLERVLLSSRAKIELKWRAWSCQTGSWVRIARGEFAAGGCPARKRAVSLAVAVSALTGAAAFSAKAISRSNAAIILRIVWEFLHDRGKTMTYRQWHA